MQNAKHFDLWADGYDKDVGLTEESGEYPFAGYSQVLNTIYQAVRTRETAQVLDMGLGTAVLSRRLYDQGYQITGFDFSPRMLTIAREKMPDAELFEHDFTKGFPAALAGRKFDFILCTYAIHHLSPTEQAAFLKDCRTHLAEGGSILLGDVAFAARADLERCRADSGDGWDEEEFYPIFEELKRLFPTAEFEPISFCAGVIRIPAAEQ